MVRSMQAALTWPGASVSLSYISIFRSPCLVSVDEGIHCWDTELCLLSLEMVYDRLGQ